MVIFKANNLKLICFFLKLNKKSLLLLFSYNKCEFNLYLKFNFVISFKSFIHLLI